jgi:hypothetical protein
MLRGASDAYCRADEIPGVKSRSGRVSRIDMAKRVIKSSIYGCPDSVVVGCQEHGCKRVVTHTYRWQTEKMDAPAFWYGCLAHVKSWKAAETRKHVPRLGKL